MSAEDMRLLSQTKNSLTVLAVADINIFLCHFPKFPFPQDDVKRVKEHALIAGGMTGQEPCVYLEIHIFYNGQ